MKKYSGEIKQFITDNVHGITTKDLVALVNAEFGLDFTEQKMRSFKKNHKLKNGRPKCVPAGLPTAKYPAEIQDFIKNNYVGIGPKGMAQLLNETFGTTYTHSQMKAWYSRHKLNSGITGYYSKGHVPANKGKKGINYEGMKATQFKKGNKSHNWVPIGTERISKDGYTEVKIADGQLQHNWRLKHLVIWEAVNGPLPKGHALIFADGNRQNINLDNLILVTRGQLARLNQNHLIQNDAELTKSGIIIAEILSKIGERKRLNKPRRI